MGRDKIMKRSLMLILGLVIGSARVSLAGIGDSDNDIAEFFGQPIEAGSPNKKGITTNVYRKGNYIILIQFLSRHSLAESYTRADKLDFSENELSGLLEGSSAGHNWIKDPKKLAWERTDGKASAWCQTLSGWPTLLIQAK
jgi:hypothetical protein